VRLEGIKMGYDVETLKEVGRILNDTYLDEMSDAIKLLIGGVMPKSSIEQENEWEKANKDYQWNKSEEI
jgi:hypothetical protein